MSAPRPNRSAIAVYSLWAAFSLLMIVISIQDSFYDTRIRWWQPILWDGSSLLVATVWFIHRRRTLHRYRHYLDQPAKWMGAQLKRLPLTAIVFVGVVYGIRHAAYYLLGMTYEHEPWAFVFIYESIKLALYFGLWLGILFSVDSYAQWQEQREHLLAAQSALAEAQLSQLKAQLQPHFLFNALNTISSLMHSNVDRADRLLASVGDLLRLSLQTGEREFVSLEQELQLLKLHSQIMQERFEDRLNVSWNVSEAALSASIPSLLLQPLLENAFKHGVERSRKTEAVSVDAKVIGDRLSVNVYNSGSTLAADAPSTTNGIGIRNCRERLRVLYGDDATLLLAKEDNGVKASIDIPFRAFAS